jgi:uncharacterized membrane protein YgcG
MPFTVPFEWEILKEYRDKEGYVDSKKIEIGFFDSDDDGVVDNPEIFDEFVTDTIRSKWIFQKKYTTTDNIEDFRYVNQSEEKIEVVLNEEEIFDNGVLNYDEGTVFYQTDKNIFKTYNDQTETLDLVVNYRAFNGRDDIIFQYIHSADEGNRIDPSSSNIIDVYLLTRQYDIIYRQFLRGVIPNKPLPPSSDSLFISFGQNINKIKSISDEVIYHPVKYKVLFGNEAADDLKATFKIVKNQDQVVNENELKADVIAAIDEFFAIENWEFGDTFYFSELSAYIMNKLSPKLSAIVIVPQQNTLAFGSLFEIKSESDEIFISSATVDNIESISAITAARLRADGAIYTENPRVLGIISSPLTQMTTNNTNTGSSFGGGSSGGGSSGGGSSGGGGGY